MNKNMLEAISVSVISVFSFINCETDNSITFQIKLHQALQSGILNTADGDKVVVRGSFNDWQSDSLALADTDKDSIFTGRYVFPANLSGEEYKFVIVKSDGKIVWEDNPDPGNPPYGNRRLNFSRSPQILDIDEFRIHPYDRHFSGSPVQFSVPELQADFKQLREALEDEHCCLYTYTSEQEFEKLFDERYASITAPLSPHGFFRLISPISAKIGCGHSGFWMPGNFWNIGHDKMFPLQIRLIDGQVVVGKNYTDSTQVPPGSILLMINNRPVWEIVRELKENYAADAFNEYFRLSQVERRFAMLLARMYGFEE